jgi:hypothetical protein
VLETVLRPLSFVVGLGGGESGCSVTPTKSGVENEEPEQSTSAAPITSAKAATSLMHDMTRSGFRLSEGQAIALVKDRSPTVQCCGMKTAGFGVIRRSRL